MSSIIELEFPYSEKWLKGYLVFHRKEGRFYVQLIGLDARSTTSYARYKMSISLGRFLCKHEHVDHIDEDKTNDDICNLQVISLKENNRKHVKESGKSESIVKLQCPSCNEMFDIPLRTLKSRKKTNNNTYCSRKCNGRESASISGKSKISDEMIGKIKSLRSQGLSSYKISDTLGVARNTVMKYW